MMVSIINRGWSKFEIIECHFNMSEAIEKSYPQISHFDFDCAQSDSSK